MKDPLEKSLGFFLYKNKPLPYNTDTLYGYKYNMTNGQAGKGSKRRPTNEEQYRDNYDKIFNSKKKKISKNKKGKK
jgi:hypothetical protein